jgi:hypothetical protein
MDFNCFIHQQKHFEDKRTCAQLEADADWVAKIK